MTVSDMNIASLLDVFDYALVLIYGLALDVFISGGCDTPRQKRLIAYLCPCFLVVQLLGWLTLGELAVKQIYPLIVHLPLVLILVLALKKPWGIAIVSTATAYLCCQPPRWGSMAVEALTHSARGRQSGVYRAAERVVLPVPPVLRGRGLRRHDQLPHRPAAVREPSLQLLHF